MQKLAEDMMNHTELNPWYWISYGEKCYAFAVVAAFPLIESDPYPTFGTQLSPDENDTKVWIGDNGTKMLIDETIANIEQQNGDTICKFIAAAHAHFMGKTMQDCGCALSA
jgi:hypothetical protein